jgi:hypothetical protein
MCCDYDTNLAVIACVRTATTISWALYYIAKDPVLQAKLHAEADAAFKSDTGT